jgi:hypothetical protein
MLFWWAGRGTFTQLAHHYAMKRFFLGLLVTLTVLRGFVGDAMAVEMSGTISAAASVYSEQAEPAQHGMPCHSAEKEQFSPGTSSGCMTCQLCHLSAFVTPSCAQVAHHPHQFAPAAHRVWFASAAQCLLLKPPIS